MEAPEFDWAQLGGNWYSSLDVDKSALLMHLKSLRVVFKAQLFALPFLVLLSQKVIAGEPEKFLKPYFTSIESTLEQSELPENYRLRLQQLVKALLLDQTLDSSADRFLLNKSVPLFFLSTHLEV